MKRFIRYLYEYEQGKRLRNVGFVKVEQKDEDCTLNIHGKGLHMKGERKLDVYLFFDEDDGCAGIWQGTVDNVNPAINYRLFYTKEDVAAPENFQRINGIILESETGRKYAAVWNDAAVDVGRMRVVKPDAVRKETVPEGDAVQNREMPAGDAGIAGNDAGEEAALQGEAMRSQEGAVQNREMTSREAVQNREMASREAVQEESVSQGELMQSQEEAALQGEAMRSQEEAVQSREMERREAVQSREETVRSREPERKEAVQSREEAVRNREPERREGMQRQEEAVRSREPERREGMQRQEEAVRSREAEPRKVMQGGAVLQGEFMQSQETPSEERDIKTRETSLEEGFMGNQGAHVQDKGVMMRENPMFGRRPARIISPMRSKSMQGQGTRQNEGALGQENPSMPDHAMHAGVPREEESAGQTPAGGRELREEPAMGSPAGENAAPGNRRVFPQSDVEFGREMTAEPIENICGDTRRQMPKERLRCTKIQRNDIARLPRCEWKWANNSFLLHGYYNYRHLAIIDDGERYRLGVPGIYHPQEAKAASTFGFTEFIPHKDMDMDLTDDERSSQEQFGYWCRPIKRMLKTQ